MPSASDEGRMRRTRLSSVLLLICALALVALVPAATASASQPASAAKKCRKGYKRAKVKRRGHVRVVCRKVKKAKRTTTPAPGTSTSTATPAPSAPAGPTVAEVEAIIRGGLQAQHQSWLGPESIEVIFERPTQVLSSVQYDPYGNDPLHAGGPIEAWPVRAWVKYISHQDATPEDDTRYTGCDAHLDQTWPHDSLYMFFRSSTGSWDFRSTSAKPGDC